MERNQAALATATLPFDAVRPYLSATAEIRGDDLAYIRSTHSPTIAARSRLRVVDLFSGCGGMSLGVKEACAALGFEFEAALAADVDPDALAVYRANLPVARTSTEDVSAMFPGVLGEGNTDVEGKLAEEVGNVDLLIGGPPCQGHSDLNNTTRRNDPKNRLYSLMGRAAEVLRPRFVIVENVAGAFHDRRSVVQSTELWLKRLGYATALILLDAADVGVAQRRKRLFLLGSLGPPPASAQLIKDRFGAGDRDVRWAIGDLVGRPPLNLIDQPAVSAVDTIRRIEYLFANDVYDLPNDLRPACHRDKTHSYKSVYGRLRWDQKAQTVTGGFYSMCMGRYVHPSEHRTITAHEAARLQFFPDFFSFSPIVKRGGLAKLIGNAVPVKMAYAVALAVLSPES